MTETEHNMELVLIAFDTLFNKRDYASAQRFWSPDCITVGCHPRRSYRQGIPKWAADVRRHVPHAGLTLNARPLPTAKFGGSADVTPEWQGRRDHRRQQRYRLGSYAEVHERAAARGN